MRCLNLGGKEELALGTLGNPSDCRKGRGKLSGCVLTLYCPEILPRLLECLGAEATCWVSSHLPEAALLWCPRHTKSGTRSGPWEAQQLCLALRLPVS